MPASGVVPWVLALSLLILCPINPVNGVLTPQLLQHFLPGAEGIALRPYGNEQQLVARRRFHKGQVILQVPSDIA